MVIITDETMPTIPHRLHRTCVVHKDPRRDEDVYRAFYDPNVADILLCNERDQNVLKRIARKLGLIT